jgi:hypothetical protein
LRNLAHQTGDAAEALARLHQRHREHDGDGAPRLSQREALAQCLDGPTLDRRRHVGGSETRPRLKAYKHLPVLRPRWQLINPNTSPNELNLMLMPHSIIHGDVCFAYFSKIWGIRPWNSSTY